MPEKDREDEAGRSTELQVGFRLCIKDWVIHVYP